MSFTSEQLQLITWLIPVPPLLSFALIVLFTNRSKLLSHTVAIALMALSWIMSWAVFFSVTFGRSNSVFSSATRLTAPLPRLWSSALAASVTVEK